MTRLFLAALLMCAAGAALVATPRTYASPDAQATKAVMSVQAPEDPPAGKPFTVDVAMDGATSLFGFQFVLTYNREVLKARKVTESAFLASTGRNVSCIDQKEGTPPNEVRFACFTLQDKPEDKDKPGPSGSGVLATIEFEPVGDGDSSLELSNMKALQTGGEDIPLEVKNALVTVKGGGGTNWLLWGGIAAVVALVVGGAAAFVATRRRGRA